ncbi:MAG TPA: hypothetical protein VFU86_06100 [Terriglobales bacterium]|nr:hypothetical protein [Terriglobales bacterium]
MKRCDIAIAGRRAVVVICSDLVGKPMALMLLHENATVTICHSRTRDLAVECGHADILVAAIGRPAAITAGFIKPGAVLINNVGMNRIANEAENVSSRARAPRCIRKEWLHPGRDVEPLAMRGISSADTVATSDLPLAYPPVNPNLEHPVVSGPTPPGTGANWNAWAACHLCRPLGTRGARTRRRRLPACCRGFRPCHRPGWLNRKCSQGGLLVQVVAQGSSEDRGARQIVDIGNVELGVGGDLIMAIDGHRAAARTHWYRPSQRSTSAIPLSSPFIATAAP